MKDLLLDSDTLLIRNNDFVIGDSDSQNINDVLQAEKGEFKRTPQLGVGATNFINSPTDIQNIKSVVQLNLELDGFTVQEVIVEQTTDGLTIIPYAERL